MARRNSSTRKSPDRQRVPTIRQRAPAYGQFVPRQVVPTPPGQEKYSAVLFRFAEPMLNPAVVDTLEAFEEVFSLAVAAWNLAFRSATERDVILNTMLTLLPPRERLKLQTSLKMLIKRKHTLFDEYDWPIESFTVRESEDGGFFVKVLVLKR